MNIATAKALLSDSTVMLSVDKKQTLCRWLTESEVLALKKGDVVLTYYAPAAVKRLRITSVKTWKRDPDRREIHWKCGMYQYGRFDTVQSAVDYLVVPL